MPVAFDIPTDDWSQRIIETIAAKRMLRAANDNAEASPRDGDGLPEHLCYPPGAVGDFCKFIVGCARFPSAPLALAGALSIVAALAGRRYRGPTGSRTNVYMVGLADSGHGKDLTLRAPLAIVDSTTARGALASRFFISDLASVQGLQAKLRRDPSGCLQKDEFGKWLATISGKRAQGFEAAIATAMLQLTGAVTGTWGGVEKAAGQLASVVNPCFSIHGVSTPSTFWHALSDGSISEGLLGRLILFDAGTKMPAKVRAPDFSLDDIPAELTEYVKRLVGDGLPGTGDAPQREIVSVPYAPGVQDAYEDFDDRMRAEAPSTNATFKPMLMRVAENSSRLALMVAIGCDPAAPVITMEIQRWANTVAEHSYRTMARGAADNIADNARQADYLRIRGMIVRKKTDGVTHRDLIKQLKGSMETRIYDDILKQLIRGEEAAYGATTAGSGQRRTRWWGVDFLPEGFQPEQRPAA